MRQYDDDDDDDDNDGNSFSKNNQCDMRFFFYKLIKND